MSLDYVRKLVSGKKARFIDAENAVNLDLVYVTDRIIIMGYPAVGVSALYRNRRRDVLRFINTRHGEKWWIWNLCPLYENAYSPESMDGRVSRYPFPDHHPPPLPLLPLAVREMTAWLEQDQERIAIIHCKAGKGRSGTLLCSYLLSLQELPLPPQLDQNYSHADLLKRVEARKGTNSDSPEDGWVIVGAGEEYHDVRVDPASSSGASTPARSDSIDMGKQVRAIPRSTNSSTTTLSRPSPPSSIDIPVDSTPTFEPIAVGDEGVPGQPGQMDRTDGRVDEVFRMHSSRRMKPTSSGRGVSIPSQRRWCRYIHLLFSKQAPAPYINPGSARILVKSITLLLHPPSRWQKPLASLIVGSGGAGNGKAWASVARYDDRYVEELRERGGSGDGVRSVISWGGVGGDGEYDKSKMFRSCGRMVSDGSVPDATVTLPADSEKYNVHHLTPNLPDGSSALVIDQGREVRVKLHLASLPLGWLWIIPAFHLPAASGSSTPRIHSLTFDRSQLDFPIGPGTAVHQVIIQLEEVTSDDQRSPAKLLSSEEEERTGFADRKGEEVREDS